MLLKPDEIKQILDKIMSKWTGDKKCPICQHTLWASNDRVVELPEFNPNTKETHYSHPVLPLVCTNCNYIMLFNLVGFNILDYTNNTDTGKNNDE